MPRRILALISARFSKSQRSCSSCVSSRRSRTSPTLLEPVAWSCFRILASNDASRIQLTLATLQTCRLANGGHREAHAKSGRYSP